MALIILTFVGAGLAACAILVLSFIVPRPRDITTVREKLLTPPGDIVLPEGALEQREQDVGAPTRPSSRPARRSSMTVLIPIFALLCLFIAFVGSIVLLLYEIISHQDDPTLLNVSISTITAIVGWAIGYLGGASGQE
jgi:hypothetical protein